MDGMPVDFQGITELAKQKYGADYQFLIDKGVPAWLATAVAGANAGVFMSVPVVVAVIIQGVLGVGSFFATAILKTIGNSKDTNRDDYNAVVASSANELLGTNLSAGDLSGGDGASSDIEKSKVLGDALLAIFEGALGNLQPVSPEDGAANARKFAGFSVNFALSQAFTSILTEASTLGFLKEFHELPDGLQRALGLGRLQRAALAPLVRNCISQPYDLYLRKALRPDRLSDAQYVKAMGKGDFSEEYVRERLAEKGFPEAEIDYLLQDLATKLSAGDLATLIRYGEITEDDAVQQLVDQGISKEVATQTITANLDRLADPRVNAYISKIQQQLFDGFIDTSQFMNLLDQVPWSKEAKDWERQIVGAVMELPRKRVSFAQLKAGVVAGHVDFSYVDTWLRGEGYGDEDQQLLTMEIIDAMTAADAKAAAKSATHAKIAAKGKTPPATLKP